MKRLTILIGTSLLIFLFACQPIQSPEKGYTITGEVTGFPDSSMIYLRNLATDATFDSAMILEGEFQLKGTLTDPPEQIWLNTWVGNKFAYANLLIGNENIHVRGDLRDFPWYVQVEGSDTQDARNEFRAITAPYDQKRDSLVNLYFALTPEERSGEKAKEIWDIIGGIDSTTEQLRIDYVKTHTDTHEGLINLSYLRDVLHKDSIRAIFDAYTPEVKNSKYGNLIRVFLQKQIAKVGDDYYDFAAFNSEDKEVKFSEVKGKYTLLEFTAAYCGPCIEASEELRELHRAHGDSLGIISFSGDPQKKTWLKSLKRDTVTWTSLWDGKGKYSETAIQYDVNGFPTFYLIDEDGKIAKKWFGYREGMLKKKLEGVVL